MPNVDEFLSRVASAPDYSTPGTRAVIMAGGRSERMRRTNGPRHKALVEVGGIPLIERNLLALMRARIDDVVVVTSGIEPEIDAYLLERAGPIAQRFGARVGRFVESAPLGNIGVVGALNDGRRDLLVVYVDNVTSISATELLRRHRLSAAALTIAAHRWPLRNPFGELNISSGRINGYEEKPVRHVWISSGTCVVGPRAAALVPSGQACSAAELCAAAIRAGLHVAAYEHDELWIDINDADALAIAEQLVHDNPDRLSI